MLDPARLKSTGVHWLRGEPRQCADRAHRLIPPSLAPTGERRPSMACLRPIPAPPRLSPSGCPWLRRSRLQQGEGNARRSGEHHIAKDVAARGFRPSGTWMYRARVLEQDAQPRGGRNPLAAAAPARSQCCCPSAAAPPEAKLLPMQRRPLPEAKLLPLQRRPLPEAKLLPLQRRTHPLQLEKTSWVRLPSPVNRRTRRFNRNAG